MLAEGCKGIYDVAGCGFRAAGQERKQKKCATRNPQLPRLTNGLFFNHKMHPPVFGPGLFGFSGIDRAFLTETDRYESVPFDAFAD